MSPIDRAALADFLRRSRERLDPGSFGLPPRNRTRTPGLRREDVAQQAGISVDYYTRLEQSRGAHPSAQVAHPAHRPTASASCGLRVMTN